MGPLPRRVAGQLGLSRQPGREELGDAARNRNPNRRGPPPCPAAAAALRPELGRGGGRGRGLALGLADYWIHFRDPGIRVLSLLAVLAAGLGPLYRYLRPVLARRLDDVAIAQKIERRFPALRDRLSSSVEFLKASPADHQAGSAALRELVIAETTAAVKDLDLTAVLEQPADAAGPGRRRGGDRAGRWRPCCSIPARPAWRWPGWPIRSAAAAWPRQNDLVFRNPPERVAAGQTFEVELVDSHGRPLPDEVRIHYLYETDGDDDRRSRKHAPAGRRDGRPQGKRRSAVPISGRRGRRRHDGVASAGSGRAAADRFAQGHALSAGLHRLARRADGKQSARPARHARGLQRRRRPSRSAPPRCGKTPARRSPARCRPMAAVSSLPADAAEPFVDRQVGPILVRVGRHRRPGRRTRKPLGDSRRCRRAAQRHHRATRGQRLRHSGGRRAFAGDGQRRLGRPAHHAPFPCRTGRPPTRPKTMPAKRRTKPPRSRCRSSMARRPTAGDRATAPPARRWPPACRAKPRGRISLGI